ATGSGLATRGFGPPGTTTVGNSAIMENQAIGGRDANGQSGGDARGGGLANTFGAVLTVSDSTLTGNHALGGAGGTGGHGGGGLGGGLFNDRPSTRPTNPGAPTVLTVLGSTITDNEARGGAAAGSGAGGGLWSGSVLVVLGSSLVHNVALGRD